jgi:hypothetical protein
MITDIRFWRHEIALWMLDRHPSLAGGRILFVRYTRTETIVTAKFQAPAAA